MAQLIRTVFQVRRDTEANWLAHQDVVPGAGEPCLTLDGKYAGQVKFGDGVTAWGDLPYVGIGELQADEFTIIIRDGVMSLAGSDKATAHQSFRISADGTSIEWFDSASKEDVNAVSAEVAATKKEVLSIRDIMGTMSSDLGALRLLLDDKVNRDEVYTKAEIDAMDFGSCDIATEDKAGIVKSSSGNNKVAVNEDGTMEIKALSWDVFAQNTETIIMDGGNAATI